MKCPICGHLNSGPLVVCGGCGGRMDLSAAEIQAHYARRAREEKRREADSRALRLLVFSLVFLAISITLLVMAGDIPEPTSYIPSATVGTDWMRTDYDPPAPIREILIPLREERK